MDVSRKRVAKRERYHFQKAEGQLLEKARMLKDEKEKMRKGFSRSSKTPVPKWNSKDSSGEASSDDIEILESVPPDQRRELPKSSPGREEQTLGKARMLKKEEDKIKRSVKRKSRTPISKRSSKASSHVASSSDVEVLGKEYIPLDQRMKLQKSTVSQRLQNIVIDDQTPFSSPGRDSKDANQKYLMHKDIGAHSRSISVSSSEEGVSSNESNDNNYNRIENQSQRRQVEIVNDSLFCWESSSEEDGGESDNGGSHGGENRGRNVEMGETSVSISESSSEEAGCESDDSDYNGDESVISQSDSDELSYDSEDNLEGGPDKHDDRTSSGSKMIPIEEMEYKEVDTENKKSKAANIHEESENQKKVLGSDIWVDGTKRAEAVRKSRLERLRPCQDSESRKKKLESVKPSSPIRVSDSESNNESGGASYGDNIVQKRSRQSSRVVRKQSKRKICESKDTGFMNIITDSIWEKCDLLKENLPPLKEKDPNESALPLKFRFEDEDRAPLEKSEAQKEVENLFADLEMGWNEDDIGTTTVSKEENNDSAAKVTDPLERCWLGYHFLILDEQIGVICKYCGIVQQEMKHILPNLKIPSWRRHEQFDSHNDECSISYGFQFWDYASGDHRPLTDTEGPVLDLIPTTLRRQMYPHQLDGFQFLWKNIAGANMIEDIRTPLPDGGTGCIISHAPGTGKTYLIIVFLLTFMKVHPTCHPMIIAPLTMLRAWADELKRWKVIIPFHNLNDPNLSGEENPIATSIFERVGSSKKDRKREKDYKRMVKLYSWTQDRSILGIGYNLFEKLAGGHRKGDHTEKFRKILLELPSILILDEGHTPRNQNSLLWKALTKVKTGRRIILSGTPFQNNFDELYNTFCLVNPQFAECTSVEMCRRGAKRKSNPAKGRWASLTNLIDKNAVDAVEELRAMMDPFVHVHKGTILQESLPGLRDTLVVLSPTDLQQKLLMRIPDNVLEKVHLVSLVSIHPSLVAQREEFYDHKSILEKLEMCPEAGVKTQFVMEIVRLSKARGEKVLIFSEYIDPLNFLMKQLTSYFSWKEGRQVLYMDGQLGEKQRQLVIHTLNAHDSEAQVLLASTKACSEGISLVGASRVVLLDVVWNPSVERQAISRAYRLGQKKFVYVYHLITSGTMEVEKYQRKAKKDWISELVFSSPDGHNNKSEISGIVSGDNILEAMVHHKKLCRIFEKILHQPKGCNVFEIFNSVSSAK